MLYNFCPRSVLTPFRVNIVSLYWTYLAREIVFTVRDIFAICVQTCTLLLLHGYALNLVQNRGLALLVPNLLISYMHCTFLCMNSHRLKHCPWHVLG